MHHCLSDNAAAGLTGTTHITPMLVGAGSVVAISPCRTFAVSRKYGSLILTSPDESLKGNQPGGLGHSDQLPKLKYHAYQLLVYDDKGTATVVTDVELYHIIAPNNWGHGVHMQMECVSRHWLVPRLVGADMPRLDHRSAAAGVATREADMAVCLNGDDDDSVVDGTGEEAGRQGEGTAENSRLKAPAWVDSGVDWAQAMRQVAPDPCGGCRLRVPGEEGRRKKKAHTGSAGGGVELPLSSLQTNPVATTAPRPTVEAKDSSSAQETTPTRCSKLGLPPAAGIGGDGVVPGGKLKRRRAVVSETAEDTGGGPSRAKSARLEPGSEPETCDTPQVKLADQQREAAATTTNAQASQSDEPEHAEDTPLEEDSAATLGEDCDGTLIAMQASLSKVAEVEQEVVELQRPAVVEEENQMDKREVVPQESEEASEDDEEQLEQLPRPLIELPIRSKYKLMWQQVWDMLMDDTYHGSGARPEFIFPQELATTYGCIFVEDIISSRGSRLRRQRHSDSWAAQGGRTGVALHQSPCGKYGVLRKCVCSCLPACLPACLSVCPYVLHYRPCPPPLQCVASVASHLQLCHAYI